MINLIIPIYKSRDTLPQALNSLLAQTKKMFLVTLVQDCDNEDYSDIITKYRELGLKIKHIVADKNGGPGVARQIGMDSDNLCDYFMFMDSDDMLMPRAIEILYHEAKINDADIIKSTFLHEGQCTQAQEMNPTTTPVTWMHGKIYKAQYLRNLNIRFLPELDRNEDSYFNLVAFNCTEKKYNIQEATYIWRNNENSITRSVSSLDFFKETWEGYIYSQVQGILDIISRINKIQPALLALTLLNIYSHCMRALDLNYNLDETSIPSLLSGFTKNEILISAIHTEEFWVTINNNLKASAFFEDKLVFFKERFCDWMKKYIVEELL